MIAVRWWHIWHTCAIKSLLKESGRQNLEDPSMCLSTRKGTKMDCNNYRTIALIPHASKIVLGIIHQRMLSYYEQELSETQAGFTKDNGTRDQIMNLRLICEKQIEHSKNVYCCFIDYSKAFDCVVFELMWRTLLSFGIPKYLVECLKDLYQNQTAEVETAVGRTGPLSVQRGVHFHQCCSTCTANLLWDMPWRNGKMALR